MCTSLWSASVSWKGLCRGLSRWTKTELNLPKSAQKIHTMQKNTHFSGVNLSILEISTDLFMVESVHWHMFAYSQRLLMLICSKLHSKSCDYPHKLETERRRPSDPYRHNRIHYHELSLTNWSVQFWLVSQIQMGNFSIVVLRHLHHCSSICFNVQSVLPRTKTLV